jgi:membrane protein DedA with SNARE-associated domain
MREFVRETVRFVGAHGAWAPPLVFALAFAESLAFLSLLVPAWGALVAIGALLGPSGISFWPVWIAGALGAAAGDWLSYWVGFRYRDQIAHIWPLSKNPELLPRGHRFVERWGVAAVFIGRFSGPLRASVPLVCGVLDMPRPRFQLANFSSAFIWVAFLLLFGDAITRGVLRFMS